MGPATSSCSGRPARCGCGARSTAFTGSGLRIRRQGVRDITEFWGHAWQSALFGERRAFGYIAYPPRPDGSQSYNEGLYLFDGDGDLIPAEVGGAMAAPARRQRRGRVLELETADGTTRIEAEIRRVDHELGLEWYPGPVLFHTRPLPLGRRETYRMLECSSMRDKITRP